LSTFISEVIAVVLEDIVRLLSKPRTDFSQELHEDLFGKLGKPEVKRLCGSSYL